LPEAAENSKKNPPGFIRFGVFVVGIAPSIFKLRPASLPLRSRSGSLKLLRPPFRHGFCRSTLLDPAEKIFWITGYGCSLDDVEASMNWRVADAPGLAVRYP